MAQAVIERIPLLDDPPEERRHAMTQRLPSMSNYIATDVTAWAAEMLTVRDHELWRDVDAESWDDYCVRIVKKPLDWCSWIVDGYDELRGTKGNRPLPEAEALEAGRKKVAATMAAAPAVAEHRRPTLAEQADKASGRSFIGYGTTASYIAGRLKRDHPAIAAAAERGDYSSMSAAARAAGIRGNPRVSLGNAGTVARTVVRLMGDDYAAALAENIQSVIKGSDTQ